MPKASISYSFIIWLVYSSVTLCVVFFRFKQGKWKLKNLVEDKKEPEVIDDRQATY
jgi:hypothetical protein